MPTQGSRHPWRQYPSPNTAPGTPGNLSRPEVHKQFKPVGERQSGMEDIECSCTTPEGDDECPVHGLRY